MELITTEDSYADRRQLFKDIWDTAMLMEEKETDIANKPKVIKTLRLDDDNKFVIGKKKKERIKNLRTVCKKILDYCDRQDADEFLDDQITGVQNPVRHNLRVKQKKLKTHRKKKKITHTKSLHAPTADKTPPEQETVTPIKPAISDGKDNVPPNPGFKYNKTSLIRRTLVTNYNVKGKPAVEGAKVNSNNTRTVRRKVVKKKHSKRKKPNASSDSIDVPEEWHKLENAQTEGKNL
ncbi:unnamed protein product [Arctia plantaginis]|uniref:Uncharacterized protein n=1 Tax=Arctia plantaginis TaxID=874455 RepID=A0A8S1BHW4_ARCPL|nr:unnamed protein product [Arctia plantaginis]